MEGNELSPLGGTERKPVRVRQVPSALLFPPPPAALWDWSLAGTGTSLATGPGCFGKWRPVRAGEAGCRKGKPPWFLSHSRDPKGKPQRSQKESGSSWPRGRPRNPHLLPEDGKSRVGLKAGCAGRCVVDATEPSQLSTEQKHQSYSGIWLSPKPDLTQPQPDHSLSSDAELLSQPELRHCPGSQAASEHWSQTEPFAPSGLSAKPNPDWSQAASPVPY